MLVAGQRRLLEVSQGVLASLDPTEVLELIADSLGTLVTHDARRGDYDGGYGREVAVHALCSPSDPRGPLGLRVLAGGRRAVPRQFAGHYDGSWPSRDDGPGGDDLLGDGVPRRPAPVGGSAAVALVEDDADDRLAATTR